MTNEERFRAVDERIKAFVMFCHEQKCCASCPVNDGVAALHNCRFRWLALEAEEEKPMNCPFCGGETHSNLGHLRAGVVHYWVDCISPVCMYRSAHYTDKEAAIAAHNRVCRAVKAAKESEANHA